MPDRRPYILTIGGFDQSSGAGITSDIKTFMSLGCYGYAVQTCLTVQNKDTVDNVVWHGEQLILEQIDIVFRDIEFEYVKVSLTEDLNSASHIMEYLSAKNKKVQIIWDPVIWASSGFEFRKPGDEKLLKEVLEHVFVATPNWNEFSAWSDGNPMSFIASLESPANIYLKGGHNPEEPGTDFLFLYDGQRFRFPAESVSKQKKHGSGCVFSSALTAYCARGIDLIKAGKLAKAYTFDFLESTDNLLGNHNFISLNHIKGIG